MRKITGLALAFIVLTAVQATSQANLESTVRSAINKATKGFKDLTMTVKIGQANQNELKVIGKDFGRVYEFETSTLVFKTPDKYKMTAKAGIVNVTYIVTGDIKRIKAGVIKKTENIKDEPHKKQGVLDVGIVTDALWDEYVVDSVTRQGIGNSATYVIQYSYSTSRDKKERIWISAKDFRLLKREKREADGSLRSRFVYGKHKEYAGIWIPTEVKVYNKFQRLAGASNYTGIKVNTGVTDDAFK